MKVPIVLLFASLIIGAHSVELQDEEEWFPVTEEPYPVKQFSQLLNTLKELDVAISRVLNNPSPDKAEGEKLILDLQGYVMNIGPLIHHIAGEEAEVMTVANSVYRHGAPQFLAAQINSEVLRQNFDWDEDQMTLLHTLHGMCVKTWQNFLNMCERHRVEG